MKLNIIGLCALLGASGFQPYPQARAEEGQPEATADENVSPSDPSSPEAYRGWRGGYRGGYRGYHGGYRGYRGYGYRGYRGYGYRGYRGYYGYPYYGYNSCWDYPYYSWYCYNN